MEPRILIFDIENSPLTIYSWGIHDEPSHSTKFVANDWYVMCWAAKWIKKSQVYTSALPDFRYNKKKPSDKQVLKKLWDLLDEADIVIAHNGRKFDCRKANARFIQHGMPPPSPYRVIDTLIEARKHFLFTSNRLGDLGYYLGVGEKMETGGFDLWKQCMDGDRTAWKIMQDYCKQDVLLLEKVYEKLRPYMKTHPNLAVFAGGLSCTNCGSENLIKRGMQYTNAGVYQRYRCKDCGAPCRGAKGESMGDTRSC